MNLVSVPKSLAPPGLSAGLAATDGGMAYIAPERLEEIGATTEVVAKRPWTHPTGERLGISSRAVLPTGNVFIVFVDHGGGQVEPREIRVGTSSGGYYEVISGLKDGDRVFNSANFLIDAECRIQGVLKTWGDPS
jgi:multidrug efflux pump subunit AcrA (membrane-fusion protein)